MLRPPLGERAGTSHRATITLKGDSQVTDGARVVERILRDRPAFHGDGQVRWDVSPGTLHLLARLAGSAERTLEVGCGVSTVVFAAAGTSHIAVSPVRHEYERIEKYCAEIGVPTA